MNTKAILEDYKNKMFTKDIQAKYNISWKKLTKLLKQENVYKKNNSLSYSEDTVQFLKDNYGKLSNKEIASALKISEDWLIIKIKELGISLRGSGTVSKPMLENFEFNSQGFSYYLGWMAADGNISKTYRNITLSIADEETIEKFHKLFPEAKRYTSQVKGNKRMYQLIICSVSFAKKLAEFGLVPNKTRILDIPENCWSADFVRGYFEGDGHVRNTKTTNNYTRYEAGFVCASKIFTNQLVNFLTKHHIKSKVSFENNSYYRIRISEKENLFNFYKFLYTNCNQWYLSRKKQILDLLFSNE